MNNLNTDESWCFYFVLSMTLKGCYIACMGCQRVVCGFNRAWGNISANQRVWTNTKEKLS